MYMTIGPTLRISADAEPSCECRTMVLNILIFPPTNGLSHDACLVHLGANYTIQFSYACTTLAGRCGYYHRASVVRRKSSHRVSVDKHHRVTIGWFTRRVFARWFPRHPHDDHRAMPHRPALSRFLWLNSLMLLAAASDHFLTSNLLDYPSFSVVPDSVSRHKECGLHDQNHVGW